MDRQGRISFLVEHAKDPYHKGVPDDADVVLPGGSPECGGSVVVYLEGDGNGGIKNVAWTGQGDTISMGATSIIMQRVRDEDLTMQQVLDLDYDAFVDGLGRDVIGNRTRNATLGLSTLKGAIRVYQRNGRSKTGWRTAEPAPQASTAGTVFDAVRRVGDRVGRDARDLPDEKR